MNKTHPKTPRNPKGAGRIPKPEEFSVKKCRMTVDFPPWREEELKTAALKRGQSLSLFMSESIQQRLDSLKLAA